MHFSIPLASDEVHLAAGKRFQGILAYSLEDDFERHSVMRTAVEAEL